ncbi:hypothetical protein K2173_018823 [Erythroxylum novogranatense]|uniref:E2 ubiquitin-conjugating enzyme n=1 Tax=Erythroxylum novogranatense TaxID=1862640 RepID=A0AAV8SAY6_9ROSI|nr:hypothetical protein K2173_018823 [Erythroxylum novogranatense]
MEFEGDGDPNQLFTINTTDNMSAKGKSVLGCNDPCQSPCKDASPCQIENCINVVGSLNTINHLKASTSESVESKNNNSCNSDLSYPDGDVSGDDAEKYIDDVSDYDYDYDDFLYEDDYFTIQSQFDNVDLPPGVEATLPWLKDPASSVNKISGTSTSALSVLPDSGANVPISAESKQKTTASVLVDNGSQAASSSSSISLVDSNGKVEISGENDVICKYKNFKQFDIVEDFSDHHYCSMGFSGQQPTISWGKRIQEEWRSLEKDLPETIFVRVCEARMELLRAVIIGPGGTPYHDGLFVFDCLFPSTYPNSPPMVYYYSGGLRLNPNLYECGKVCLSLLGTWSGKQTEKWMPGQSTMLQVLVSIQGLILNDKPFFNEPGYEKSYVGAGGERRSKEYNENVFILSLKTMMYTLRRPPKYFEDFVIWHFHVRARDILVACEAYLDGATVGCDVTKSREGGASAEKTSSSEFRVNLRKMKDMLVATFTRYGSIDCKEFRVTD